RCRTLAKKAENRDSARMPTRALVAAGCLWSMACSADHEAGRADGSVGGAGAPAEGGAGGKADQNEATGGAPGAGGTSGPSTGGGASGGKGGGAREADASTPVVDASRPNAWGHGAGAPAVDRSDAKLREFVLDPKMLDPTVQDSLDTEYADLDTRA